jgi:hypothetical protein
MGCVTMKLVASRSSRTRHWTEEEALARGHLSDSFGLGALYCVNQVAAQRSRHFGDDAPVMIDSAQVLGASITLSTDLLVWHPRSVYAGPLLGFKIKKRSFPAQVLMAAFSTQGGDIPWANCHLADRTEKGASRARRLARQVAHSATRRYNTLCFRCRNHSAKRGERRCSKRSTMHALSSPSRACR